MCSHDGYQQERSGERMKVLYGGNRSKQIRSNSGAKTVQPSAHAKQQLYTTWLRCHGTPRPTIKGPLVVVVIVRPLEPRRLLNRDCGNAAWQSVSFWWSKVSSSFVMVKWLYSWQLATSETPIFQNISDAYDFEALIDTTVWKPNNFQFVQPVNSASWQEQPKITRSWQEHATMNHWFTVRTHHIFRSEA